jgi:hypothetical protein
MCPQAARWRAQITGDEKQIGKMALPWRAEICSSTLPHVPSETQASHRPELSVVIFMEATFGVAALLGKAAFSSGLKLRGRNRE